MSGRGGSRRDPPGRALVRRPNRGSLWWARASAWTCVAFVLSVGAHVLGGGGAPGLVPATATAMALLWVGLVLTRRRLGPVSLVLSLGTTQVVLHAWFMLTSATTPDGGTWAEVAAHLLHMTPSMALAHLIATLAIGWALAKGEAAAWFVAGLLRPKVPELATLPASAGNPPTQTVERARPGRLLSPDEAGPRGPPRPRAHAVT